MVREEFAALSAGYAVVTLVPEKLKCVVLTGAGGRIGRQLRAHLAPLCESLRLVDQVMCIAEHANETVHTIDLCDAVAVESAVRGAQAIVHFAGYPREADWQTLLGANMQSVINLWEAARAAGVGRVVYASSNHAVGFYPRSQRIGSSEPPRPDSRYGVTKVFMESVASLFAVKYGVRGFGIRIGHCIPEPKDARMLSHWVHPDDLASLVIVGLTAPYQNEIVYGVSSNARSWWRNDRAEALGYRPVHSADAFEDALRDVRSDDAIAERYQGGNFAAAEYIDDNQRPH
jgi:uronate dehydrogenase